MSDAETEKRLANIVIHAEAEKALRQCRTYIERLRREKKLGYTHRPPASIDKKYLEIYVARAKQRRVWRTISATKGNGSAAPGKHYYTVPADAVPGPFNLLTIAEVAIELKRSAKQIRYLCLHGRIPYLPGEPRLIDEVDVTNHFERKRAAQLANIPGTPEFEAFRTQEHLRKMQRKARTARILRELDPKNSASAWNARIRSRGKSKG